MATYKLADGFKPGRYGRGYMVAETGNQLPVRVAEQLLAAGVIEVEKEQAAADAAQPKPRKKARRKKASKKKATRRRSRKE